MNTKDIDQLGDAISQLDYLLQEGVIFNPQEVKRLLKLSDSLRGIISSLEVI
jgi:hypothetical protein